MRFALLTSLTLPVVAAAKTPPQPPQASSQAAGYVAAAGRSDLHEIRSSQIAMKKAKSPQVRRYGQMLVTHHRDTTAATLAAARKAGMSPPPPGLDAGAARSISELDGAAPADLDRVYLRQQSPAHQAALSLHQAYGRNGDQAPLRASAEAAIPIVQAHLSQAEKLWTNAR
ncbi:MAG: DUF4142 domain-containing protein [Sphingomonas adhaesiva]|uniref:DUF4142 domain-containing protein n=1 Tax=Sphingomonas adhaesiva TaxID=28212 RepID=UPI002FFCA6AC